MSTGFWLLETTSSYNRFHNRVEDSALVVPEIKVEFHSDVLKLRADFCLNWKICGLLTITIYEVILSKISTGFDKYPSISIKKTSLAEGIQNIRQFKLSGDWRRSNLSRSRRSF